MPTAYKKDGKYYVVSHSCGLCGGIIDDTVEPSVCLVCGAVYHRKKVK